VGYEAALLLDSLMRGKKPPKDAVMIPPKELVVRASSDFHAVSDPRVARALSYMAAHSAEQLSVSMIAQFAGVGRQTLERGFRQCPGRTVNEELIRLRISTLERLLVQSQESIKELSNKVGFGTTANMFTMFKRHAGMTPKEYRGKTRISAAFIIQPRKAGNSTKGRWFERRSSTHHSRVQELMVRRAAFIQPQA